MSLTSTARELSMWGRSLESIARDLERAVEQVGDELKGDEDAFVRHLSERITTIESLLQQVRLGLWQQLTEAKLRDVADWDAGAESKDPFLAAEHREQDEKL